MIILFDTNVILDVWLKRQPHLDVAAKLMTRVENGTIKGYLCATTLTTLFYISRKELGTQAAFQAITGLLDLFDVALVNRPVLKAAVAGEFADFEDGVLYEAARRVGVDAIVTRNASDFQRAEIPIHSPDDLNALLDLRDE